MSNLAHELMADEEWARLSDAERIHRLELVIDLLLDLMIADEIARHPPRLAQPTAPQADQARRGRSGGRSRRDGGSLPTCD